MPRQSVNLEQKLSMFKEHWSPKSVASFNDHDVMVVKVLGEFNWHKHDDTDDFFLVLSGALTIRFRDEHVVLGPGERYEIPRGVDHCTSDREEVHLLLI